MASQNTVPNRMVRKNYNIIEIASTESQSIESHGHETSKTKVRSENWTEVMDSTMLNLMTEEHVLGNFVNGSFTTLAWTRIVHDFNARSKVNFGKNHLQNGFKVLKRQFIMYQMLANKSGLGWDYDRNIPTAGDPSDWDAVVAENPAYSRCRDKPFPAYQDIAFLFGKTTATGRHGFTTGMHDLANYLWLNKYFYRCLRRMKKGLMMQLRIPLLPTPMKSENPNTSHASAHTSSGKRRRLSSPSHKATSTSTRKGKLDYTSDAIQELVNLGKKRLNIAEQMLQRELDARPKVHSIEECMFLFVCTGWEGSAADMRVLRWCCQSGGFMVPEGYANTDRFLAPFRGERYHLSQFDGNTRARTHRGPRDLYNHRHTQLRNVVEKAFGILKKRFKVLRQVTPFPYKVQCRIDLACCVIHNFIKRHQGSDIYFNMQMEPTPLEEQAEDPTRLVGIDESRRGDTLRTMIT
uniref:Myb/SANT-like domain-containing protein n=1 Tax=Ananas comosus var. bracteatus TaxID=296719 RepID=A0A6V7NIW5_ANACO|nr:unnamed protein product [Ananas comosus var. bracteatus]